MTEKIELQGPVSEALACCDEPVVRELLSKMIEAPKMSSGVVLSLFAYQQATGYFPKYLDEITGNVTDAKIILLAPSGCEPMGLH